MQARVEVLVLARRQLADAELGGVGEVGPPQAQVVGVLAVVEELDDRPARAQLGLREREVELGPADQDPARIGGPCRRRARVTR